MKNSIFEINSALKNDENEFTKESLSYLNRSSPLSVAWTVNVINLLKNSNSIRDALNIEYRFTYRATQYGDFLEGIRAQIIEKDKKPKWKNKSLKDVSIENIDLPLNYNPYLDASIAWSIDTDDKITLDINEQSPIINNKKINNKLVSFSIKNFKLPLELNREIVDNLLKKTTEDLSKMMMYT